MQKIKDASAINVRSGPNAAVVGSIPESLILEIWDITWDAQSKRVVALAATKNELALKCYAGSTGQATKALFPAGFTVQGRMVRRSSGLCLHGYRGPEYGESAEACLKDGTQSVAIRQLNKHYYQEDYHRSLSAPLASLRRRVLREAGINYFELREHRSDGNTRFTGSINFDAFHDQYEVNNGGVGQPMVRFSKDHKAVLVAGSNIVLARFDRSWKKIDITTLVKSAFARYTWFRPLGAYCDTERAIIGFACQKGKNPIVGRMLHLSMKSGKILGITDGLYVRSVDVYR